MIESNADGNRHIEELIKTVNDEKLWSPWEQGFLQGLKYRRAQYAEMTTKQKEVIARMYGKLRET